MKIYMCSIQMEVNSFSPMRNSIEDFGFSFGNDMLERTPAAGIFDAAGDVEIIPGFYGNAVPSGVLERGVFDRIADMLRGSLASAPKPDGVWLYMHGSMEVEGIGSGELELLRIVRDIVGQLPLIALALDFHACNHPGITELCDIICGYKTAPHEDMAQTQCKAAELLLRCLRESVRPRPLICALPLILAGDAVITSARPYDAIGRRISEMNGTEGILDASLFIGQNWADTPNNRASAIVTYLPGYDGFADGFAREMTDMLWRVREEFAFQVEALSPAEALAAACRGGEASGMGISFLSDSGDNVTAGAGGASSELLSVAVERGYEGILFAGIYDPAVYGAFDGAVEGESRAVRFEDRPSREYAAAFCRRGELEGWDGKSAGNYIVLSAGGNDIIVTQRRCAFISPSIIDSAGVDAGSYRAIAVKLGYLYPKLQSAAKSSVIALTEGASCVDIRRLPYRHITRPCWPLDNIGCSHSLKK